MLRTAFLLVVWSTHVAGSVIRLRSASEPASSDPGGEESTAGTSRGRSSVGVSYRGNASNEANNTDAMMAAQEAHAASLDGQNALGEATGAQGPSAIGNTTKPPGAFEVSGEEAQAEKSSQIFRIGVQCFWGVIYYILVVRKYPQMHNEEPNERAIEIQDQNEVSATLDVSVSNFILAWVCPGPRGAHTFHSVGVMNYWLGCILMSVFPCCTLWYTNSCTDLNEKLGGDKRSCIMSCLCAFCCHQCVIAQDAESLDAMSGTNTRLCGVRLHNHKHHERKTPLPP